jgi:hypothetical protein
VAYKSLELQPISFAEAAAFVTLHHRHHTAPVGHKFSIAINDGEQVVGVVMVGRPVSRKLDNTWTLEVNRCCVLDNIPNGCSMLYSAAWRAAKALGYKRLITYTLQTEPGTSLKAAGWKVIGETAGKSWNVPTRHRVDKHPLQPRLLWEA